MPLRLFLCHFYEPNLIAIQHFATAQGTVLLPRLLQWDKVRGDVNPVRHDKKGTAFFIVANSVITKTNGIDL